MISNKTLKPNERRTKRAWHSHPGMWRFSTVKLLVALVLLIVMTPFFEEFAQGDLIETLITTVVLVVAVIAIGAKRGVLITATLLLIPAIIGRWLSYVYPQTIHPYFFLGFGIAFMTLAVMEAVTGTFYVAILIARLVAMYVPASRLPAQDESRRP